MGFYVVEEGNFCGSRGFAVLDTSDNVIEWITYDTLKRYICLNISIVGVNVSENKFTRDSQKMCKEHYLEYQKWLKNKDSFYLEHYFDININVNSSLSKLKQMGYNINAVLQKSNHVKVKEEKVDIAESCNIFNDYYGSKK